MAYRLSAGTGTCVRPDPSRCLNTATGVLTSPVQYYAPVGGNPWQHAYEMWNGVIEVIPAVRPSWYSTLGAGNFYNLANAYDTNLATYANMNSIGGYAEVIYKGIGVGTGTGVLSVKLLCTTEQNSAMDDYGTTQTAVSTAVVSYSVNGGTTWVTMASADYGNMIDARTAYLTATVSPSDLWIKIALQSQSIDLGSGMTVDAFSYADIYDINML